MLKSAISNFKEIHFTLSIRMTSFFKGRQLQMTLSHLKSPNYTNSRRISSKMMMMMMMMMMTIMIIMMLMMIDDVSGGYDNDCGGCDNDSCTGAHDMR